MPFDINNIIIEALDVYKRGKKEIIEHCLELLLEEEEK